MESTKELRTICQGTRESAVYQMNRMDRYFLRNVSIHITRLCLLNGRITANQVTFASLCFVIAAGFCFLLGSPRLWIIGVAMFVMYMVLDCVDGEIARYRIRKCKGFDNRPLGSGAVLGGIVDWFTWPYMLACMSLGLFLVTGSLWAILFGFVAVIARSLYMDVGLLPYSFFHEHGILDKLSKDDECPKEPILLRIGRTSFGAQGFIVLMLVTATLDWCAVSLLSARLVYLALFGLAATFGVLLKARDVYRNGARIQRI